MSSASSLTSSPDLRTDTAPILKALLAFWKVDSRTVYGKFTSFNGAWKFRDLRLPSGERVPESFEWNEWKIGFRPGKFFRVIPAQGHVPAEDHWGSAKVALRFSGDGKRLEAYFKEAQCLTEIPSNLLVWTQSGSVLLSESVYQQIKEAEVAAIHTELADITTELTKKKKKVTDLTSEISGRTAELQQREGEAKVLDAAVNAKRTELDNIERSLAEHRENHQRIVRHLESSWRNMRAYAASEVEHLHNLDLVPSELYAEFVCKHPDPLAVTADDLSFGDMLHRDVGKLAGHVQSYLYKVRGLYYERDLLDRILTAVRTHDLVILAGCSGSGKSQIVKGIGEAIGAEVRVVPVRPNWTSPDDLLGYYNPLQKCYNTTPFLDLLIEASKPQNQNRVYFLCLDEMNLARPEYYFADFLSALEERSGAPCIQLYSDLESSHNFAEVRRLFELMKRAAGRSSELSSTLIDDPDFLSSLQTVLSAPDKETVLQIHARLRRTISASLQVPSVFKVPANVRLVGTVNMDETTFQFSAKLVDRAHVIRFDSPRREVIETVRAEIEQTNAEPRRCPVSASEFSPERCPYPEYEDPELSDIRLLLENWNSEFLTPLGIELGFRTIRQAMNYQRRFLEIAGDSPQSRLRAVDHVILSKLVPRFSFDGSQQAMHRDKTVIKRDLVEGFKDAVESQFADGQWGSEGAPSVRALRQMLVAAKLANGVFNYWL